MGSPTSERKPAGLTRKKVEATPANQIVNALSAFAIVTGAVESLTYTPQTPDNEPASSEGQQTIIYSASPKSLDDISDFLSNQLELLRLQQQTQPEQPIGPEPTTPQRREFSLNPEVINPNYSTTVDYGPTGIRLREHDSTTSTKLRDLSNTLETRVLGFSNNGEKINNDSEWVYVEVTLNNGEVLRGYISLGVSRDSFNTPGDQGTLIENAYTKQYAQDLTNLSPRDTVTNSIEINTGGQRDLGSRINTEQKTSAMGKVIENFKTQVLNQIPEELQDNTIIVEVIDLDQGVLELVPIHTDEVGSWLLVQDTEGATHQALIPNGSTLNVISGPNGTTFNLTFEGTKIAEMGAGISFTPNPNIEGVSLEDIDAYLKGNVSSTDFATKLPRTESPVESSRWSNTDVNIIIEQRMGMPEGREPLERGIYTDVYSGSPEFVGVVTSVFSGPGPEGTEPGDFLYVNIDIGNSQTVIYNLGRPEWATAIEQLGRNSDGTYRITSTALSKNYPAQVAFEWLQNNIGVPVVLGNFSSDIEDRIRAAKANPENCIGRCPDAVVITEASDYIRYVHLNSSIGGLKRQIHSEDSTIELFGVIMKLPEFFNDNDSNN